MAQVIMRIIRSNQMLINYIYRNKNSANCSLQRIKLIRSFASALFIPGSKASETFSYLSPYLDFDKHFFDAEKSQQELLKRGINLDTNELKKLWEFYKYMESNKTLLEKRRQDITSRYGKIMKIKNHGSEEEKALLALQTQGKVVKRDIKMIQETLWELEENVVIRLLKLPNKLDERTPTESAIILESCGKLFDLSDNKRKHHLEIGKNLGFLDYRTPAQYFLCNEAVSFELGVLNLAGNIFDADGAIRVAGSDFSRSLVVEGSGLNHNDPIDTFVIENYHEEDKNPLNHMHLVGGASLVSFLAMHAKQQINPNSLPVKYFSTGRQYTPTGSKESVELFATCQHSVLHVFSLVKNFNEYQIQLDKLISTTKRLYDNVCSHYRIVLRTAAELKFCESLRISFEMWSSYSRQYVEIGYLSGYEDYHSKRLLITYQVPTGRNFPLVISGTVLSVPRLLACLLEENPNEFVIPSKVAEYMPENYASLWNTP